jgi:FkbM family methyltransferase
MDDSGELRSTVRARSGRSRQEPPHLARRPHIRGELPLPLVGIERGGQMIRLYNNWPIALGDRLGLIRGRQLLYSLQDRVGTAALLARANGCDVRTINEIWLGGLYIKPLGNHVDRASIIVDIGANCGYFAVYAGRHLPGSEIVCFEPERDNRRLASANIALNDIDATIRHEAIVPDSRTSVSLHLSNDPRLHTTVEKSNATAHGIGTSRYSEKSTHVPAANINTVLREILRRGRITLLKIDVEGIDLELVAAMDDDVLAGVDHLVAETELRETGDVTDRLTAAGFRVTEEMQLLMASRAGL